MLEVIATIILVFFALSFIGRLFFRYVLPWWLSRFLKKQQKKYSQQFYSEQNVDEDEKIRYNESAAKGTVNPDVGEYVDFEEVDDDGNKE
jgi:hypothetical protein